MITFPCCKINIGLSVLSKRPDGYHDIRTLMYPVRGLCDSLEILPDPESEERVMLIPHDDFQSQFVCQGEEHLDEEEFIWCKVMTPDGKIGWVRSDLMNPLY